MKKIVMMMICTLLCVSCFAACSKDSDEEPLKTEGDYFVYPMEGTARAFDVDNTGTLYYLYDVDSGRVSNNKDMKGEAIDKPIIETMLYSVDFNGNISNSYILGESLAINGLVIEQGIAFYTTSKTLIDKEDMKDIKDIKDIKDMEDIKETVEIGFYEFSMDSQSTEKLYQLTGIDTILDIEVVDDCIYFMGIDNERINKEYTLASDEDSYYYLGEVMGVIDTLAGTMSELAIDFPIAFSKTLDNNLMIFAHDGEEGYYFTEYSTAEGSLSEKIYHDLYKISKFDIYNEKNDIIYNSINTSVLTLSATSIEADNGTIELMPNVGVNSMVCQGEYTYYANGMNSNKIERIKNSAYIRDGKSINMLSSMYSAYTPFGCGYTIERQYPTEESFALSVLSQDTSFDVCLMSSRQGISSNIRNKGSFYPLGEVEGVADYLEACFPYMKDAATTEDGGIWMLPIAVDIPCLLYNESLCRDNGIDLSVPVEFETFIDSLSSLHQNNTLKNCYSYSGYILTEDMFYQYLRSYNNFDNEYFIKLASLLKEEVNYEKEDEVVVSAPIVWGMLDSGETDNFLFDLAYSQDTQLRYSMMNDIRACELPHITENKTNIATCIYLCVNPSSRNLKEALNYISSLCHYLAENNDIMILQDRTLYPDKQAIEDLYNIYANGEIQFTLPDELFMMDYEKYLLDEIDLSTLVQDANRKIEAFLKE